VRLAEYRKQRGLKQADVAAAHGVSVAHVSQLENKVVRFTIRLALEVEDWSGGEVPADELLEPDDAKLLRRHVELANRRACAEAQA
jgi:transcriptional regulator with XRE-family HTH domain